VGEAAADELDALCPRPMQYRLIAMLPRNNYGKILKDRAARSAGRGRT
jgi:hypothetical protein